MTTRALALVAAALVMTAACGDARPRATQTRPLLVLGVALGLTSLVIALAVRGIAILLRTPLDAPAASQES